MKEISRKFEIFADYFQFYIQDEAAIGDLSDSWGQEATDNMIALAPGTIGIGTVRNTTVDVELRVMGQSPSTLDKSCDRVNECSISIVSGKLVIAGCSDYFPDAERIDLENGVYSVRIQYRNLDSLSDDRLSGSDKYEIIMWPGEVKVGFSRVL